MSEPYLDPPDEPDPVTRTEYEECGCGCDFCGDVEISRFPWSGGWLDEWTCPKCGKEHERWIETDDNDRAYEMARDKEG